MNNSKKTLKVLIVFVVLLIIAIAGVAYTYFFTDVFKSEKQKFFKYTAQNLEKVSLLDCKELNNYYEKKNTQCYKNSGEFYIDVDEKVASIYMPNKKVYNEVKDFKIVFDGEKDLANNYEHDTLSLKYSNNEKLTFEFLRENDYYGLKVDTILKKYLVLENNNLKEFARNLGLQDTKNIPDKIEFNQYKKYMFTEEELNAIKQKALYILNDSLQDTMFREEKFDGYSKCTLTLTNAQIKNIVLKLYQAMINDEEIINKFKDFARNELNMTEQEIENQIENANKEVNQLIEGKKDNSLDNDDENNSSDTDLVSISVYNNKKSESNLISFEFKSNKARVTIEISDGRIIFHADESSKDGESIVYNPIASLTLEKKMGDDLLEYIISADTNSSGVNSNFDCLYKLSGLKNADTVDEEIVVDYKEIDQGAVDNDIKYTYKNTVEFTDNIEKIDVKSNGTRINNYNGEKMLSIIGKLATLIDNINKKQMNSLGLEADQNPLFYISPTISDIKMFMPLYIMQVF